MVIDAAKGIEAQTRKLFEVCRLRDMPIMTFINKMDREAKDPIELLDEIASTAGARRRADDLADRHRATNFKGVYDLAARPHAGVRRATDRSRHRRGDRELRASPSRSQLRRGGRAGAQGLSRRSTCESYREGHLTPVVLRQRLRNFGVRELLDALAAWAPPPRPQPAEPRADRADRAQGRGLRLQGPGQHGPQPPRPRRLPAPVLRQVPARHEAHADGHRQAVRRSTRRSCSSPASARSPTRRGPATSSASPTTACSGRRHADRGRDDHASPASPTSRPRSCGACGSRTR